MKNFDAEIFAHDLMSSDILNGSQDEDEISWDQWKLAYTEIQKQIPRVGGCSSKTGKMPESRLFINMMITSMTKNRYRRIWVIGHIAKMVESLVSYQIIDFLESHSFISMDQYAHLKRHSTQTCLHRVKDDWLEHINDGEITGARPCLLDISKRFYSLQGCHFGLCKGLSLETGKQSRTYLTRILATLSISSADHSLRDGAVVPVRSVAGLSVYHGHSYLEQRV